MSNIGFLSKTLRRGTGLAKATAGSTVGKAATGIGAALGAAKGYNDVDPYTGQKKGLSGAVKGAVIGGGAGFIGAAAHKAHKRVQKLDAGKAHLASKNGVTAGATKAAPAKLNVVQERIEAQKARNMGVRTESPSESWHDKALANYRNVKRLNDIDGAY